MNETFLFEYIREIFPLKVRTYFWFLVFVLLLHFYRVKKENRFVEYIFNIVTKHTTNNHNIIFIKLKSSPIDYIVTGIYIF